MGEVQAGDAAALTGAAGAARIATSVQSVIAGQDAAVRLVLAAFLAGGHVLIEDNPGTGKTTLARALAASIGARFRRVQFTPDLLPSDIVGVSVFNPREQSFEFHQGPLFTQILLADEINRASPRTQSALLEAMAEGQVTAEGRTTRLDDLFFVIATQNPVEFRGTYPLPEAQMDRFAVRVTLGYVSAEEEVALIVAQGRRHPLEAVREVMRADEVVALRQAVREVRLGAEVARYAVDLARATRGVAGVLLGAGPRASLALTRVAQAMALIEGMGFVTPGHIRSLAQPVLAHRLALDPQARFSGLDAAAVVHDILARTPMPA